MCEKFRVYFAEKKNRRRYFRSKSGRFFLQVPSFLHRLDSDAISLVIVVINDSYYIEYVSTTE